MRYSDLRRLCTDPESGKAMRYHILAFLLGFLLDLVLGDPYYLPHPVRLIGKLIAGAEKCFHRKKPGKASDTGRDAAELRQGTGLVLMVLSIVVTAAAMLLLAAYHLHPFIGMLAECVMTYQLLAVKCLKVESMKVYHCLQNGSLQQARAALSMIVGRDTDCLDEEGIVKAAVETVAENTSDGVVAPMLYLAVGGPVLGFFYKAVNTMDSMIGYRNEEYLYFGRPAARLDDVMNFIPSRISAFLMIGAAFLSGSDFSAKGAAVIYKRDRRKHASPNSAQTEAVCAGALGLRLAGDARYFGRVVHKPYIGDELREAEPADIRRANRLLYGTAWLGEAGCVLVMLVVNRICGF